MLQNGSYESPHIPPRLAATRFRLLTSCPTLAHSTWQGTSTPSSPLVLSSCPSHLRLKIWFTSLAAADATEPLILHCSPYPLDDVWPNTPTLGQDSVLELVKIQLLPKSMRGHFDSARAAQFTLLTLSTRAAQNAGFRVRKALFTPNKCMGCVPGCPRIHFATFYGMQSERKNARGAR